MSIGACLEAAPDRSHRVFERFQDVTSSYLRQASSVFTWLSKYYPRLRVRGATAGIYSAVVGVG